MCRQHDCSRPAKTTLSTKAFFTTLQSTFTGPAFNASLPTGWLRSTTPQYDTVTGTTLVKSTPSGSHKTVPETDNPITSTTESTLEHRITSESIWSITDKDSAVSSSDPFHSSTVLDWNPLTTSVSQTLTGREVITDVSLYSNGTAITHQDWSSLQTTVTDVHLTSLVTHDDATDTSMATDTDQEDEDNLPTVWWLILYGVIVIVGILSNMFAMFSILLMKKLRTAQNMFVLNLCLADIFLGINALFTFITILNPEISIQDDHTECYVIGFFTFIPPLAVVLSMTVIARNRYQVIVQMSTNHNNDMKKVATKLLLVWVISIVVSLPILSGLISVKTYLFCTCCFYFAENLIYGLTVTVCVAVIPNLVIIYSYIRIVIVIRSSRKRVEIHKSRNSQIAVYKKGDIRIAIQFIVLFVVFNICYLPTMIVFWTVEETDESIATPLRAFIMILFACNLIANPVIYFVMNKLAMDELKTCCRTNNSFKEQEGPPDQPLQTTTPKHKVSVFAGASSNRISPREHGHQERSGSLWNQDIYEVGLKELKHNKERFSEISSDETSSVSNKNKRSQVSHLTLPTVSYYNETQNSNKLHVIESDL